VSVRGLGDRWLAGDAIDGVAFAHHEAVVLRAGPHAGSPGRVLLLASGPPDPHYLVRVDGEPRPLRVRQSELAHAH
jgi:hypothetical protein